MILSQLVLNPFSRQVQKEIANPYEMHRTVMRAFPDGLSENQERVLFRLEQPNRDGRVLLLVQSWSRPDWSYLQNGGGYLFPGATPNPAVKEFDLKLAAGQSLAFRLRANPTAKRIFDRPDGRQKKRVGLYREEEQLTWLQRKASLGGFALLQVRTARLPDAGGRAKKNGQNHSLKLLAVQFDGLLRVVDPDQLVETVRRGIGSGKGLGFGLLSVGPARMS